MSPILLVFLVLITTQLAFVLTLSTKLLRHQSKPRNYEKSVSVVIASRNEEKNLETLLERLVNQVYPNYEVIIANDRSEDNSQELLGSWSKKYPFIKVINIDTLPPGWTGKKNAIYQAVSIAEKDVLLFTDADCFPLSAHWIKAMTSAIKHGADVVLGYSPYTKKPTWLNRFIQFETLLVGLQYLGFSLLGKSYMGVGRNMAIRKDSYDLNFLERIKGLEGGDDDLMISHLSKNGVSIKVEIGPGSFVYSKPKSNLQSYLKQKIRHLAAGKHYHKKDQTLLGIFTLSWLVGWGLLFFLIFFGLNINLALMVFGIRSLAVYLILNRLGRKLNTDIDFWALPFLDFCYCFYYPWVAVKALATKQVEWK